MSQVLRRTRSVSELRPNGAVGPDQSSIAFRGPLPTVSQEEASWCAHVSYRTEVGATVVELFIDSLDDLADCVRLGPNDYAVEGIAIVRLATLCPELAELTVEAAARQ
jgi:hypothetical protein